MLNLRLLYILLDARSVRVYLGIVSILGFGVLVDIILFLKLSLLIGPWVTMAFLAAATAIGIVGMYRLVSLSEEKLLESIDGGVFITDIFARHIGTLVSAAFIIIPGIVNTLCGLILLAPPLASRLGSVLSRMAGISWQEAYEYLRLDRMTRNTAES